MRTKKSKKQKKKIKVIKLPNSGRQIAKHLDEGPLGKVYPHEKVLSILQRQKLASKRVRGLPNDALIYYVIAMGIFMTQATREVLKSLAEGIKLLDPQSPLVVVGKAAIIRARKRLGVAPLKALWEETSELIGKIGQRGCFYNGLRLMAVDGSTLDVPDSPENKAYFGKQDSSRGEMAFPQLRFVALCECGPHAIHSVAVGKYLESENALAKKLLKNFSKGMLCLMDRLFFSFKFWEQASATGADLLWRVRNNSVLPVEKALSDGSYLSTIYASPKDRRHKINGIKVRIIKYQISKQKEDSYILMTTLLDEKALPARELAKLYPQRWEIELMFDELKTHLKDGKTLLRSKSPEMIFQEFYGLLLAYRAVRTMMNAAAQRARIDSDRLSFTESFNIIRRKLVAMPALSPSGNI